MSELVWIAVAASLLLAAAWAYGRLGADRPRQAGRGKGDGGATAADGGSGDGGCGSDGGGGCD